MSGVTIYKDEQDVEHVKRIVTLIDALHQSESFSYMYCKIIADQQDLINELIAKLEEVCQ